MQRKKTRDKLDYGMTLLLFDSDVTLLTPKRSSCSSAAAELPVAQTRAIGNARFHVCPVKPAAGFQDNVSRRRRQQLWHRRSRRCATTLSNTKFTCVYFSSMGRKDHMHIWTLVIFGYCLVCATVKFWRRRGSFRDIVRVLLCKSDLLHGWMGCSFSFQLTYDRVRKTCAVTIRRRCARQMPTESALRRGT